MSSLQIAGDTSGIITLQAPVDSSGGVLNLPAVSGTLIPAIDSISGLSGLTGTVANQQVSIKGYHAGSDKGGGTFYWDSGLVRSSHNGGTVISPTVPWNTDMSLYLGASGETAGGSLGCWVRLYDGAVNVTWFGAVADYDLNKSDNYASIDAAINSTKVASGYHATSEPVFIPMGVYYVSQTIQLKTKVTLYSEFAGHSTSTTGAKLMFPIDTTGIIVHSHNTIGDATEASPTTSGAGSAIRGLYIASELGSTDITTHGIRLRARGNIKEVLIRAFAGNGIDINASSGSGGSTEGNANKFSIEGGRIVECLNGIYTNGGDANAGTVVTVDCSGNSGWGIYDSSFLGNTYVGCHTSANGQVSGLSGGFKSDNANSRNIFMGCYSEPGQGSPNDVVAPSLVISGLQGDGFTTNSSGFLAVAGDGVIQSPTGMGAYGKRTDLSRVELAIGGNPDNGDILRAYDQTNAPSVWRMKFDTTGGIDFNYSNNDSRRPLKFTGPNTTYTFNRPSTVPYAALTDDLFLGSGTNARSVTVSDRIPTSGEAGRGDTVINRGAVVGGYAGWICVVAGVNGTTAVWGKYGLIVAS